MSTPTIKTHEEAESDVGGVCGICRRQVSRYKCPPCNLFYCSLICYRSESHSRCSETFYRKELEIGINASPSNTEADRTKVLELLKRIEDQSAADDVALFGNSDYEDEEDDLACRFSAIDVSSASTDDLLRRLTKKEKDVFFTALRDPSNKLVHELLGSVELQETSQLPWWEAPNKDDQLTQLLRQSYGTKPDPMVVPTSLIRQASRGISLLYNICAIFYVTRHLSMSPLGSNTSDPQDQHEARRLLSKSVPFLIDHKSRLLHASLTDAVTSFWSRVDPESINNKTMIVLLQDVAKLIRPQKITVMGRSTGEQEGTMTLAGDRPSSTTVLVIFDTILLFRSSIDPPAAGVRKNHITMKLIFYAAHILSTPSSRLDALADEVLKLSMRIGKEADPSNYS